MPKETKTDPMGRMRRTDRTDPSEGPPVEVTGPVPQEPLTPMKIVALGIAGAGRSPNPPRVITDPGVAPPSMPEMGNAVTAEPTNPAFADAGVPRENPPRALARKDSVELLLEGIPEEQPERAKPRPQTDGDSAASYHAKHLPKRPLPTPAPEPAVIAEGGRTSEHPSTRPVAKPEVRTVVLSRRRPMGPMILAVIMALSFVLLFVWWMRPRTEERGEPRVETPASAAEPTAKMDPNAEAPRTVDSQTVTSQASADVPSADTPNAERTKPHTPKTLATTPKAIPAATPSAVAATREPTHVPGFDALKRDY